MTIVQNDSTTKSDGHDEAEGIIKKPRYPFSVFFIVSNEFCERFNYYGMRTILAIYLTQKLLYSDDIATILYHSFTTLVYFFCVFGAIIADSWWGKFNTIVWLSIVYVAGSSVLTLGAVEPWNMPAKTLTFVGLALIAIGSGGIKPCVAAFGGEQFKMPEQAKQLAVFFSLFYFSINFGSFISTLVTPILREDVKCMGMDDCFPFGFGLPAILMAVSIVIFISGKFMYRILPIQGNMFVKILKCIGNAVSTSKKEKATNPRNHWLEYAEPKFGKKLVMETKILLNVLVLYIPLPIFWALFDQQGSRWTFQATRMDGDLGWFTIKPDQMQVVNPLLILTFIPLYELMFYPLLKLIGIRRPLQKMALGGVFAGIAFICSMLVEITIEPTYPVLPKAGYSQFRMYNAKNCQYNVTTSLESAKEFTLGPNAFFHNLWVPVNGNSQDFNFTLTSQTVNCGMLLGTGLLKSGTADSFFITGTGSELSVHEFEDNPDKSRQGKPVIRVLANINPSSQIEFHNKDGVHYSHESSFSDRLDVPDGLYDISIDSKTVKSGIKLKHGGVYAVMIHENDLGSADYAINILTVTEPNSVNMLWLIPQYVIMTLGEVMFSVTGLQFSYTQAPDSMKSVIQGCWQLTVAVGNIIVTIVVGAKFFDSQTYEFLLFACLMFVDMIIFAWLGYRYKGIPLDEIKKAEEEDKALKDGKSTNNLEFKQNK
ncbi:peptide transporter family 1-like [Chironomus tepperi]|uniref:peptide transporter family 1-like n=1 Tax=Chironomus tepperi TaxID=113505 RepID=UPI00391F7931